jgi:hypothetical protein
MHRLINFDKKGQKQLLKGCFAHRYKYLTAMRVIQWPVSVARWQHGPQKCFATFICEKS